MNDKELKRLLAKQSAQVLPDDRVKDRIKRELNIAPDEESYALAHGGSAPARIKKRIILIAAAVVLATALCLGILLPVFNRSTPSVPGGLGKFDQILSTEDFYVFGAASVGSLLSAKSIVPSASAAQFSSKRSLSSYTSPAERSAESNAEIIETVNGYMALAESLLSEGNIAHTVPQTPANADDAEKYQFQTAISYSDLLGNSVTYILCYNEVRTGYEEEGKETETEYSIEGILRLGDGTNADEYEVRGSRESETDSDESESELQFTAYLGGKPYIRMEQEAEQEEGETEQKYSYTYYDTETGTSVERTVVEYEEEGGELELKMTVDKADGLRDELLFRNGTQKDTLLVRAAFGEAETVYITVYILEGRYHYEFSNGDEYDGDRHHDEDDDDDDEDDDGDRDDDDRDDDD